MRIFLVLILVLFEGQAMAMSNPFVDCASLADAEKVAGFSLPEAPGITDAEGVIFQAIRGELLEVIYRGPRDQEIRLRKAPGKKDISGDYTAYPQNGTIACGDIRTAFEGNGKTVSVATWTKDNFSFSLTAEQGLEKDAVCDVVRKATAD